jgi:magnesium transporter
MLSSTLWKAFTTPLTYCLVAALLGTAVMQVKYVNKALQRFDSTQVIPVQFVMFTLSVIIGSAVLYRDFEQTTPQRAGKFVGGCLLTFFGVFLITSGRQSRDDEDNEAMVGEATEAINLWQQGINEESGHLGGSNKYGARQIPANSHGADNDSISSEESGRFSPTSLISTAPRPQSPGAHSNTSAPHISLKKSPRLLTNPRTYSQEDHLAVGENTRAHSLTVSSSVLPCKGHTQSSSDASRPSITGTSVGRTPETNPEQRHIDVTRPTTPAKHLLSRTILPGPFISPLSPLTAVVADTVRYGKNSLRRPKLRIRRSKTISQDCVSEVPPETSRSLSPVTYDGNAAHSWNRSLSTNNRASYTVLPERSRAKSLSHAIGGFWRGTILRRDWERGIQ